MHDKTHSDLRMDIKQMLSTADPTREMFRVAVNTWGRHRVAHLVEHELHDWEKLQSQEICTVNKDLHHAKNVLLRHGTTLHRDDGTPPQYRAHDYDEWKLATYSGALEFQQAREVI